MNQDELASLARKILIMALSAYAAKLHMDNNQLTAIVTDVVDLGVVVWGVYAHWNMKKVPEDAKVTNQQDGAKS